jgi:hypothetical protein
MGLGAGLALALAHGRIPPNSIDPEPYAQVETDSRVIADFQTRVQRYVELHRTLEGAMPVPARENWAEVKAAIEALGVKIRAARENARQGDIFAPRIERWFRRRIAERLKDCDIDELLAALNEENPENLVLIPQVNGAWPEEASLGPMPPKLLAGLPELPEELQYRFMNRDFVLWDSHANIIVDFIKQAMPLTAPSRTNSDVR